MITRAMIHLHSLVEKTLETDVFRDMIALAAERPMDMKVEAPAGAARGEPSPTHLEQHNG